MAKNCGNISPFQANMRQNGNAAVQGTVFQPVEFTPNGLYAQNSDPYFQQYDEYDYDEEIPQFDNDEQESKYKTELCKNWVDIGVCKYGKRCRFAHGYDELSD